MSHHWRPRMGIHGWRRLLFEGFFAALFFFLEVPNDDINVQLSMVGRWPSDDIFLSDWMVKYWQFYHVLPRFQRWVTSLVWRVSSDHMWVCLKIVYPYTQWFCWSLSLLNSYFIGGIPHFQTYPCHIRLILASLTIWAVPGSFERAGAYAAVAGQLSAVRRCLHGRCQLLPEAPRWNDGTREGVEIVGIGWV